MNLVSASSLFVRLGSGNNGITTNMKRISSAVPLKSHNIRTTTSTSKRQDPPLHRNSI